MRRNSQSASAVLSPPRIGGANGAANPNEATLKRPAGLDFTSFAVGMILCAAVLFFFVFNVDELQHWFIIPVFVCGVLIAPDAVDWFRGRVDVFDPIGIIGLFGFHFFFLAPLLHFYWDTWSTGIPNMPSDFRPWIGGMAIVNAFGLLIYRITRNWFTGRNVVRAAKSPPRATTVWQIDPSRATNLLAIGIAVAFAMQIWTFVQVGGIKGYADAVDTTLLEKRDTVITGGADSGFVGWAHILGVAESMPILAMMAFALYLTKRNKRPTWAALLVALSVFFVLQMFFGGLRGSRSNTVFALFWAVGILHFWIRPIPKKIIALGCCFIIVFGYVYNFYKVHGANVLNVWQESSSLAEMEEASSRSWQALLLADLGRTDLQALILCRINDTSWDYQLAMGRTYYAAACIVIPRSIWPDRPPSKMKEGTEILYGRGRWEKGIGLSTRVFGLAGEAMLNFGPYVVPLFYLIPSFFIGRMRRWFFTWQRAPYMDARFLILPFLIRFSFSLFVGDVGRWVYTLFKNGALPFLILALSSRRRVVPAAGHAPVARERPVAQPIVGTPAISGSIVPR